MFSPNLINHQQLPTARKPLPGNGWKFRGSSHVCSRVFCVTFSLAKSVFFILSSIHLIFICIKSLYPLIIFCWTQRRAGASPTTPTEIQLKMQIPVCVLITAGTHPTSLLPFTQPQHFLLQICIKLLTVNSGQVEGVHIYHLLKDKDNYIQKETLKKATFHCFGIILEYYLTFMPFMGQWNCYLKN